MTALTPLMGLVPSCNETDLVVFVGCDTAYLIEHAIPLAYSVDRNSPGNRVHLHIINPGVDVERTLSVLARDLADTVLTWTTEETPLPAEDAGQVTEETRPGAQMGAKTYYACIRFARAYQVMDAAPARYLILDADCIVRKPLPLPETDLGLFLRPEMPDHMKVAAGVVYIGTQNGRNVLAAVSASITDGLRQGYGWFLDQIAFAMAVNALPKFPGPPTLHDFGPGFMDWEFTDNSVIWTGKGPRKHENQRYIDEVAKYRLLDESVKSFWT